MNSIRHFCLAAIVAFTLAHLPNSPAYGQSRAAQELDQKMSKLWAAGRIAEAIPFAERLLAVREEALGPDHPDVAVSLNNLAELYRDQVRYAEAEPLYKRSLAIFAKALSRNPNQPIIAQEVGQLLHNLGALYESEGRFVESESLYRNSLAIYEKTLGPDRPAVAQALRDLGGLYKNQGRYQEAEPLLKRSLAIIEKLGGPTHPQVAVGLNELALLYSGQGRVSEAEPLYKRALAILGPAHSEVPTIEANLAALYFHQGRYAEAEQLLQQALAIWEKAHRPDFFGVGLALNGLAMLYINQRRFAEAEPLLKRSLAIYEKTHSSDDTSVVAVLDNLAELYDQQGRYAEAAPLYKRSLAIWEKNAHGQDNSTIAGTLIALALLYDHQGRYAEAEPLYRQSLAIYESLFGSDHPDAALALHDLALHYVGQNRYTEAEPLYKRSLAIREKAYGPHHPDVSESLNDLTSFYGQQSRYADALPLVRRLISDKTATTKAALPALFGAQTGKLIDASEAVDGSLNVVQRASQTSVGEAFNALAARFSAGTDRLAELVRKDQDLKGEAESRDKALIAAVSQEPSKRDAAAEQRIRDRIAAIAKQRDELGKIFQHEFPDYAALSNPQPLTVKDIQPLLADDEALVIVELGPKKSYVWAIIKNGADWKELAITAADLAKTVSYLRGLLDFYNIKPFDTQASFELYRQILGPIETMLHDKPRLNLVLNGALTSLPPQLLVTRDPTGKALKDVDWLVRSHAVTLLPSVASLRVLRGKSAAAEAEKPLIGFANPRFNSHPQQLAQNRRLAAAETASRGIRGSVADISELKSALPPLPETADELRQVAASVHADPKDLIIGADATETHVKREKLDRFRIVYFATHGLLAGDVADFAKLNAEPALVLSLPEHPTELDDGLLTASEVAQLKLNADWVVLSACNTASGEKPGAEALSGLARAFFYAGARSLIVSNWEVESQSAVALMTGTFAALAANPKLSHGEALQKSMIAVIDNPQHPEWTDPKYWAPFVVVGEPAKPAN